LIEDRQPIRRVLVAGRELTHQGPWSTQAAQIAQAPPQPATTTDVLSVEIVDTESVARIRHPGDNADVTIGSRR
jgi:hypothetical protein